MHIELVTIVQQITRPNLPKIFTKGVKYKIQSPPNVESEDKIRICAAVHCSQAASNHLMVIYIKKWAWFCDSCKDSLLNDGLIVEDSQAPGAK